MAGNRGNLLDMFRRLKKPKRTEVSSRQLTKKNKIELTRQLEETNTKIKKLEDRFATKDDQLKQEFEVARKEIELSKKKECELLIRQLDEANRKIKELGDRLATKENQTKQDLEVAKKGLELKKNKGRELLTRQLDKENAKTKELEDRLPTKQDQLKRDYEEAKKELELKKNKELELKRQLDEANRRIKEVVEKVVEHREMTLQLDSQLYYLQDSHDEAMKREQQLIQQLARLETCLELTERKGEDRWKVLASPSSLRGSGFLDQDIRKLSKETASPSPFRRSGNVKDIRKLSKEMGGRFSAAGACRDVMVLSTASPSSFRGSGILKDIRKLSKETASPSPFRRSGNVKDIRKLSKETDWDRKSWA